MIFSRHSIAFICLSLLAAGALRAADDDETIRRPSIGVRVTWFASRAFNTQGVTFSTTRPVADYATTGTSGFSRFVVSPTVEYRLKSKLSVSGEVRFHTVRFRQSTIMKSGIVDPNTNSDDRVSTTIKQVNRANYLEFPFLVRYYGLRRKGWWRPAYAGVGVQVQHIGRVRTENTSEWADGVTDYNEVPTAPGHSNQVGAVAAVGMRLVDEATRLKVNAEVRYIRWASPTFEAPGYRSALGQWEVGIGFSY